MSNLDVDNTTNRKDPSEQLANILRDMVPVIWVGAGASIAAGYPSTETVVEALVKIGGLDVPQGTDFRQVADMFVQEMGAPALADVLATQLGQPRQPTSVHAAVARLCQDKKVSAVITTNYDDLVERALSHASVPHVVQRLDQNKTLALRGAVRVLKLHGSQEDWLNVILSGSAYADYKQRYKWLLEEFDAICQTQWLLFCGCSLRDPRLVEWVESLTPERRSLLKPWFAVMTKEDWRDVPGSIRDLKLTHIEVDKHADIPEVWRDAVQAAIPDRVGWKTTFTQQEVHRISELREMSEIIISRPLSGNGDDDWTLRLKEAEDIADPQPNEILLRPGDEIRFRRKSGRYSFSFEGRYYSGSGRYYVSVAVYTQQWSGVVRPGRNFFVCRYKGFRSTFSKWVHELTPHGYHAQLYDLSEPTYVPWLELSDAGIVL